MSRVIVISVGTSLLTNNLNVSDKMLDRFSNTVLNEFEKKMVPVEDVMNIQFEFSDGNFVRSSGCEHIEGLMDFTRIFFEKYLNTDEILSNMRRRKSGGDFLPAEISSLFLYYYMPSFSDGDIEFKPRAELDENDTVFLITTQTPDAAYCAKLIRELIVRLDLFKCTVNDKVEAIEGLNVYEPGTWIEGLKKAHKFLSDVSALDESSDKVLLRTGGYKEFSADMKTIAMELGFESYYLFERSYSFVKHYEAGGILAYQSIIRGSEVY